MTKQVVMEVTVANASKDMDAFLWSIEEDNKLKTSQKPLGEFSKILRNALPEHMRDIVQCEVDNVLRSDGDLSVAVVMVWDDSCLNEDEVSEVVSLYKEKMERTSSILEQINGIDGVSPERVVVEKGPQGIMDNVIYDDEVVCQLVNAVRKIGEAQKSGVDILVDIDGGEYNLTCNYTSLPTVDNSGKTDSLASVVYVHEKRWHAKLQFEKWKSMELAFNDDNIRRRLLQAQLDQNSVKVLWSPKIIHKSGHEEVVGGVITDVQEPPQMTMDFS